MMNDTHSKSRILLVDDDAIVLNMLTSGLSQLGYTVQGCASAQAALVHYRNQTPDIAILDYRMPDMDGLELARAMINEVPRPIIMLSAHSDAATVRDAVGLGVSAYLVKPVEARRLVPSIEAALARFAEVTALIRQGASLQEGMEKNRIINMAVGLVMERAGLPQDLAFESLRKLARDQRRPLHDVAHELVEAVSTANTILQRVRSASLD